MSNQILSKKEDFQTISVSIQSALDVLAEEYISMDAAWQNLCNSWIGDSKASFETAGAANLRYLTYCILKLQDLMKSIDHTGATLSETDEKVSSEIDQS